MKKFYNDDEKMRAKKVDLAEYLKAKHPNKIYEDKKGRYWLRGNQGQAGTGAPFPSSSDRRLFKAKNGIWYAIDDAKAEKTDEHGNVVKEEEKYHFIDSIDVLRYYVGGYSYPQAIGSLLDFEKEKKG